MIITQTPFRMSFFGGGTDIESFYRENGGAILSSTFDKYCYVNVRHLPAFFDYKTHVTYSQQEMVNDFDEIEHPLIREAMRYLDIHEIRLVYDADLPARTGLGTSSSFAVGMLNAFHALKGKYVDKQKLANEAIYLERNLCNEAGGIQDQIAASFGGFNHIEIAPDGSYAVNPVILSNQRKQDLNDNLMLFFTGFSRYSSKIQEKTEANLKAQKNNLIEMKQLVTEAENILIGQENLNEFGKMLNYSWQLKKKLSGDISNGDIDALYDKAIQAGALGGKLLGAGGGGFLLFYVERDRQLNVLNAMEKLLHVPFSFETNGTKIIYYSAEDYELPMERS